MASISVLLQTHELTRPQTQACMNFDPRRAAGNQVILFSCGGRAAGEGVVTDSQLFPFAGGAGPLNLTPKNSPGTCFTVKGNVIDQAACADGDANQSFTFGTASATEPAPAPAPAPAPTPEPAPAPGNGTSGGCNAQR